MANTHTVVGLFDNKSDAQKAMSDLVSAGFIKDHIDISNRRYDDTAATTTTTTTGTSYSDEDTGISGFFKSLFGSDDDVVRNYSDAASDVEAVLSVQVDSDARAKEAAEILDNNGAVDVDDRATAYRRQYADTNTAYANTTNAEKTIPVIEENLKVGKETIETGGVRVKSRIVEKPVEETVRLRQEHVVVNRNPVNRAVTDADRATLNQADFTVTEHGEKAVVGKDARVVEEISVGKTVDTQDEVVRDTVRHTDVQVEDIKTDVNRKVTGSGNNS